MMKRCFWCGVVLAGMIIAPAANAVDGAVNRLSKSNTTPSLPLLGARLHALPSPKQTVVQPASHHVSRSTQSASAPGAHLTTRQLVALVSPSVVSLSIRGPDGELAAAGSGFVIGDNMIATNVHVVMGAHAVSVNFPGGRSETAIGVLKLDGQHDLAIISANTRGVRALPLGETPQVGDNVVAIGNPRRYSNTVSTGIISSIRFEDSGKLIQTTAPISPGSSGGPLVDEDGAVVGIVVATRTDAQNINFAVPVGYLRKMKQEQLGVVATWKDLEAHKEWRMEQDDAPQAGGAQTPPDTTAPTPPDAAPPSPDDANASIALGNTLYGKGQLEDAAAQYKKAIEQNPDGALAHCDLAVVLKEQGKYDQSIAEYRIALKDDSNYPGVHHCVANLYNAIQLYDKALLEVDAAVTLDSKDAFAYFERGFALEGQGKLPDAEAAYRNAVRLNDKYAIAYNNLGEVLESLKRHDEARRQWEKAAGMGDAAAAALARKNLAAYP